MNLKEAERRIELLHMELQEVRTLTIQNAKLLEELTIIVKGSEELEVEGLRTQQKKESIFREQLRQEVHSINLKIDNRTAEILREVEQKVKVVEEDIRQVKEWRNTWNKVIELMTNSTTWRIIFLIVLGTTGLYLVLKFKIMELINPSR
jgi:hypothetical protein